MFSGKGGRQPRRERCRFALRRGGSSPPRPKVLRRKHNLPKLGPKAIQPLRARSEVPPSDRAQRISSQEPLSSTSHVPRLVEDASAPTPWSSWGATAPHLPLTEAAVVPEVAQPLGHVPLPFSSTEVSRKRFWAPVPEQSKTRHVVQHLVSLKLHAVRVGAAQAACVWWTCSIPEAPTLNADFSAVPARGLDWCSRCFETWNGSSA